MRMRKRKLEKVKRGKGKEGNRGKRTKWKCRLFFDTFTTSFAALFVMFQLVGSKLSYFRLQGFSGK